MALGAIIAVGAEASGGARLGGSTCENFGSVRWCPYVQAEAAALGHHALRDVDR